MTKLTKEEITSLNTKFVVAIQNGNWNEVEYLIKDENIDINGCNELPFRMACDHNNVEFLRVLFKKAKKPINIHANEDEGFKAACYEGHIDVVDFLLRSPELTDHVNPYLHPNALQLAYNSEQPELVKYLIFDYGFKKTPEVEDFIKDRPTLSHLFNLREINEQLKEELPLNKANKKKVKI